MPPRLLVLLTGLALAACSSSWTPDDADGDGYSTLQGDCWDASGGPEGSGLGGSDIHPGALETWYDGVDQDCAVDDDYDADADGFVPDEWEGRSTVGVPETGALPGGDCWDDPASIPDGYAVVASSLTDKEGTSLSWVQPEAGDVYPDAADTWYDGVDQDCAGDDDFDQDGDGWRTEAYPDANAAYGDDCVDGALLDDGNPAGSAGEDVHPGASETWYDGTDQDCDDNDCDQDGDRYAGGGNEWCVSEECDDTDPAISPDPSVVEVWYNGTDENCDDNDGDQDGDGYWAAGYATLVETAGGTPLPIPSGWEGDCWDVPEAVGGIPAGFEAVNDLPQPDAPDVNPGAIDAWYDDVDGDCSGSSDFDQDADGHATDTWPDREGVWGLDCDDADPTVNPDASESWYDGTDDDCDDNDGDRDGDTFWTADYATLVEAAGGTPLDVPEGYGGDCDDTDVGVHPGGDETCNDIDDDCDGTVDEDDALDAGTWYEDADGDGYGNPSVPDEACDPPVGYVADATDCDDGSASAHPGEDEVCDDEDNDCDGTVDEDDALDAATWFLDADGDADGDEAGTTTTDACDAPAGYAGTATDCDDGDDTVHAGATEVEDFQDNDCDDIVDEGFRAAGDVFVTEIAYNTASSEPESEWFEITNPTTEDLYLDGMTVYSSSAWGRTFTVGVGGLGIEAGGYAVLCYGDSILGPLCDYVYGSDVNGPSDAGTTYEDSFSLGNTGPVTLTLALGGTTLDTLDYGTTVASSWPTNREGYAIGLSATYWDDLSNDTGSTWCRSTSSYATDDYGTPAAVNDSCGLPGITSVSPGEGLVAGGLPVTITGTELAGATLVLFGSDPAEIDSAAATRLVVLTPAASSSGLVDITVYDGTASDTLADAFLYTGDATDVGWCDVSSPLSLAATAGTSTPVYGQVFVAGVTEASGAGAGITAQAGFAPTGSDPRSDTDWTWDDATYDADAGDNDEYVFDLVLAVGTWAYAWRFSADAGVDWLYCDAADGTTDGSTPTDPYSVADEATAVISP
jgi:hypothetical protein